MVLRNLLRLLTAAAIAFVVCLLTLPDAPATGELTEQELPSVDIAPMEIPVTPEDKPHQQSSLDNDSPGADTMEDPVVEPAIPAFTSDVSAAAAPKQGPAPDAKASKTASATNSREKPPILPILALQPGQSGDLLLTSPCDRHTRGAGLKLRSMHASYLDAEKRIAQNGVEMTIVETTEETEHPAIAAAGLRSFVVRCKATRNAKPGLMKLHVSDATCSGVCHADFLILVTTK